MKIVQNHSRNSCCCFSGKTNNRVQTITCKLKFNYIKRLELQGLSHFFSDFRPLHAPFREIILPSLEWLETATSLCAQKDGFDIDRQLAG